MPPALCARKQVARRRVAARIVALLGQPASSPGKHVGGLRDDAFLRARRARRDRPHRVDRAVARLRLGGVGGASLPAFSGGDPSRHPVAALVAAALRDAFCAASDRELNCSTCGRGSSNDITALIQQHEAAHAALDFSTAPNRRRPVVDHELFSAKPFRAWWSGTLGAAKLRPSSPTSAATSRASARSTASSASTKAPRSPRRVGADVRRALGLPERRREVCGLRHGVTSATRPSPALQRRPARGRGAAAQPPPRRPPTAARRRSRSRRRYRSQARVLPALGPRAAAALGADAATGGRGAFEAGREIRE